MEIKEIISNRNSIYDDLLFISDEKCEKFPWKMG